MRECGDCIVCCVYFQINDPKLDKKAMEHCIHLDLPGEVRENMAYYTGKSMCGNCKVHDTDNMPKTCSDYHCLWLQGYGNEEDRPDKSLMLFDRAHEVENAIEARPCEPDKEKTEEGQALIEKMSKEVGEPVIVTDFYYRKPTKVYGRPV